MDTASTSSAAIDTVDPPRPPEIIIRFTRPTATATDSAENKLAAVDANGRLRNQSAQCPHGSKARNCRECKILGVGGGDLCDDHFRFKYLCFKHKPDAGTPSTTTTTDPTPAPSTDTPLPSPLPTPDAPPKKKRGRPRLVKPPPFTPEPCVTFGCTGKQFLLPTGEPSSVCEACNASRSREKRRRDREGARVGGIDDEVAESWDDVELGEPGEPWLPFGFTVEDLMTEEQRRGLSEARARGVKREAPEESESGVAPPVMVSPQPSQAEQQPGDPVLRSPAPSGEDDAVVLPPPPPKRKRGRPPKKPKVEAPPPPPPARIKLTPPPSRAEELAVTVAPGTEMVVTPSRTPTTQVEYFVRRA
ncbi:hypothetical protein HDU96_003572, partial [Phlyctochytrium bullatum]